MPGNIGKITEAAQRLSCRSAVFGGGQTDEAVKGID